MTAPAPRALSDDEAAALARWYAGHAITNAEADIVAPFLGVPGKDMQVMFSRYVLSVQGIVAAADAQERAAGDSLLAHVTEPNNEDRQRQMYRAWEQATVATEEAVRARRAEGGE